MALDNTQYNTLMRHYDEVRARHRDELNERLQRIHREIPELKELEDTIASESVRAVRLGIEGGPEALIHYRQKMAEFAVQKVQLLASYGYTPEDLELSYDCPICKDTGLIDGEYCTCFKKAATDLLYSRYAAYAILPEETFRHFSFQWYSDTIGGDSLKKTERQLAHDAYDAAKLIAPRMGMPNNNLLLYGNTGVGKTFLTHCIAHEVLDKGYSVLYFTATELFDLMADAAFRRSTESVSQAKMIEQCDLLIIDDLGTEYTNNFTAAQLFQVINERILHLHSTIISTNLALSELSQKYTERVFSRIASSYTIRRLAGRDIRIRRKTERG